MRDQKITLEVPAETAQAYERASVLDRRRAAQAVTFALQAPEKATTELERILDAIGREAQERGLTEDKLKQLLDDE
jgi:hypothetical protein